MLDSTVASHIVSNAEAIRVASHDVHRVYEVIEAAGHALIDDPVAGPFARMGLDRTARIEADLWALAGEGWREAIPLSAGTQAYRTHLAEVCFSWPAGYVAHHYVRYMGDLSGGQHIRAVVERLFGAGTATALDFAIPDLEAFKDDYRCALDVIPWDKAQRERVIEEVLTAYRLNQLLLAIA